MTKLDHTRPLLRYLDSVRRQIALDARREVAFARDEARRPAVSRSDQVFPLNNAETQAVARFFSAIERHIDAEALVVAALARKTRKGPKLAEAKSQREAAEGKLVRAAKAFAAQTVLSGLEGRMNLYNLYKAMEKRLARESPFLWDTINELAMRVAVQEIAQLAGVKLGAVLSDLADG